MTTTAGQLLEIMRIRLKLQEDGTTNPKPEMKKVTMNLVEKLSGIDANEVVEITILSKNPLIAEYILNSTSEILAKIES